MQGVQQGGGGKYRIMSEMNMIPFIDVCLVLLIIFMVMTPFLMKSQLKVNLPNSKTSDKVPPNEKTVEVQVRQDGSIFIEGKRVPEDVLDQTLSRKLPDAKNQAVMIEADKSVPFEHVVLVMGSARKLGVVKMGVGVKTKKGAKSE